MPDIYIPDLQGFFCSLCQTLETDTTFIGNQLNTAEDLCIAQGGKAGTVIVGRRTSVGCRLRQGGKQPTNIRCVLKRWSLILGTADDAASGNECHPARNLRM